MTVRMARYPLDYEGRKRAVQFEDWDHEQLSHYAAWLEEQLRKMQEPVSEEEWNGFSVRSDIPSYRHMLSWIIAARAAKAKEGI